MNKSVAQLGFWSSLVVTSLTALFFCLARYSESEPDVRFVVPARARFRGNDDEYPSCCRA